MVALAGLLGLIAQLVKNRHVLPSEFPDLVHQSEDKNWVVDWNIEVHGPIKLESIFIIFFNHHFLGLDQYLHELGNNHSLVGLC